jgi:hypothetical protein
VHNKRARRAQEERMDESFFVDCGRERERERVEDVAGGVGGILSRKRGGSKQAVLKTTGDYSLD